VILDSDESYESEFIYTTKLEDVG